MLSPRMFSYCVSFINPAENKTLSIYDYLGIKLFSYSLETESTTHFYLRCRNYINTRITLMNKLNDNYYSVTSRQPTKLLQIILYDNDKFIGNRCPTSKDFFSSF